jgi:hypothetical protein
LEALSSSNPTEGCRGEASPACDAIGETVFEARLLVTLAFPATESLDFFFLMGLVGMDLAAEKAGKSQSVRV